MKTTVETFYSIAPPSTNEQAIIKFSVHKRPVFSLWIAFFADTQEESFSQLQPPSRQYVCQSRLSGDRAEKCTWG